MARLTRVKTNTAGGRQTRPESSREETQCFPELRNAFLFPLPARKMTMKADDLPLALNPPSLDNLRGAQLRGRAITQRCATRLTLYVRTLCIGGGGKDSSVPEGGTRRGCQITATQHQQKSSKINDPPYIFWARTPLAYSRRGNSWQSFPAYLFLSLHRLFPARPWEPEEVQ